MSNPIQSIALLRGLLLCIGLSELQKVSGAGTCHRVALQVMQGPWIWPDSDKADTAHHEGMSGYHTNACSQVRAAMGRHGLSEASLSRLTG